MTDQVYKEIIKPLNQCSLTGIEKVIKTERFGNLKVTITKDNFNQHRAVLIDVSQNSLIVCSILFDQFNTVRFKYTIPSERSQGYSKQLFAIACSLAKRKFRHSDNLTVAGAASL